MNLDIVCAKLACELDLQTAAGTWHWRPTCQGALVCMRRAKSHKQLIKGQRLQVQAAST